MASIRDLKKDINYELGEIIEAVYVWEISTNNPNSKKGDKIIDEAIEIFDDLIVKVNDKDVKKEDKKTHFKAIRKELDDKAKKLVEKLNKLPTS
ncbi:hypothetical protein OOZ15_06800 [Galbibacter sp. EGI 63066]|uniref:hypothetical protein n=1 Tax=Galbibacter sp. EGI 63066 TaxID=2993559 RepID=UPI002248AD40|nr:hypothetical protein [Galbibacter sp. EGI 63066]MCX2679645.1 hypothetical protein [Galbibacter sp. EGI 63066]